MNKTLVKTLQCCDQKPEGHGVLLPSGAGVVCGAVRGGEEVGDGGAKINETLNCRPLSLREGQNLAKWKVISFPC